MEISCQISNFRPEMHKSFWFTATIYHFKWEKKSEVVSLLLFSRAMKIQLFLNIYHNLTTSLLTTPFFQTNRLKNFTLLRKQLWGVWYSCSIVTILLIISKAFSQTFSVEVTHLKFFEICQLIAKCSDI